MWQQPLCAPEGWRATWESQSQGVPWADVHFRNVIDPGVESELRVGGTYSRSQVRDPCRNQGRGVES